jgi:hypothetical protein
MWSDSKFWWSRGANVVVIPYEIVNESGEVEVEVNGRVIKRKSTRTSNRTSCKATLAAPFSFQSLSMEANI